MLSQSHSLDKKWSVFQSTAGVNSNLKHITSIICVDNIFHMFHSSSKNYCFKFVVVTLMDEYCMLTVQRIFHGDFQLNIMLALSTSFLNVKWFYMIYCIVILQKTSLKNTDITSVTFISKSEMFFVHVLSHTEIQCTIVITSEKEVEPVILHLFDICHTTSSALFSTV